MSLNIYLYPKFPTWEVYSKEINDGVEDVKDLTRNILPDDEIIDASEINITANMVKMAQEVKILWTDLYSLLWLKKWNSGFINEAGKMVKYLEEALVFMENNREKLYKYNPKNWWWDYDGLLYCVKRYKENCMKFPTALIHTTY